MTRFFSELGLSQSAEIMHPDDSLTCVSDDHRQYCWMDYYVSAKATHSSAHKI